MSVRPSWDCPACGGIVYGGKGKTAFKELEEVKKAHENWHREKINKARGGRRG